MEVFEKFRAAVNGTITQYFPPLAGAVCTYHGGVCYCSICVEFYKETHFSMFNNICEAHGCGQCLLVTQSDVYMNQLEFILNYAEDAVKQMDATLMKEAGKE